MVFKRHLKSGMMLAILVVVIVVAGCGSKATSGSSDGGRPSGRGGGATGAAVITADFYTTMGDNAANYTIHLAVIDASGNTVHTADAVTNSAGIAEFKGLPVGEYTLSFTDDRRSHCEFKVNLGDFTGDGQGKSVGSCTF